MKRDETESYPRPAVESGGAAADAVWPPITVNILAYNRREELRTTVQKITGELDYPAEQLEIIVVDNASIDGTREMLATEFPTVRVIANPRNEGIAGWNRGFEAGRGDYFLVLDDDCYMQGNALQTAVREAQHHHADLVSFLVEAPNDTVDYFQDYYDPGLLGFWGCSALISRRAITALKGFDPNIKVWAHELEFTIRLLDAGLKHLHLPNVVSSHLREGRPDRGALNVVMTATTLRHYGYIAAKLLQARHAVLVALRLFCRAAILSVKFPYAARAVLPVALTGFARGLRARAPVRTAVSSLFTHHLIDFANPLAFVGSPERFVRFRASRPQYYPKSAATLDIAVA